MSDPDEIPLDSKPVHDASDKEQVDKQKRDAGRRKKQAEQVVKQLMTTPGGRQWVWQLLERGHLYETSFTAGDPMATAFREGERNATLRVLADVIKAAPELYLLAMKENGRG